MKFYLSIFAIICFFSCQLEVYSKAQTQVESQNSYDFEKEISEYISIAKPISKKKMTSEDENKLLDIVNSILDNLKAQYIKNKFNKLLNVELIYSDGTEFPNIKNHKFDNIFDEQIIKFTIGFYGVFKNLNKEHILNIIKKSPLEFVPLFREMHIFLRFLNANPKDYGHGFFSERDINKITVFATNSAILRIMKPIVYKNLLPEDYKIFKLSRITSAFYKNYPNKNPDEIFKHTIKSLKRNTAKDSRVSIFMHSFKTGEKQ